ncbi:MAG: isoleucine--tRNA ligase [Candidatus Aenigmarchaeota archaeon]|nr:isoleucine--tRNA ligase [Candidatus Aenigmarchaeota archaeon]
MPIDGDFMLNSKEKQIMDFWEKNKIYEKAKKAVKGKKPFYFLDGPPYATGHIHMGTALNKILKDCFIRFWRAQGRDVWDQPGYDTHGLPIENKVESLLKIKNKGDIEKIGIEKFNKKCRKFATEFIEVMNKEFLQLGVWMDWDNPYLTLTNEYIESAWFTFKKAFEKGLLFKDVYSVHICPHCGTTVAYNEVNYQTLDDSSIYVKFSVKGKDEYLVIWTTTPWTLLANTGVMVHPDASYARVKAGNEILIIAKNLVENVMEKIGTEYEIIEEFEGKKIEGLEYENPLEDWVPNAKEIARKGWRIVTSEQFVSLTEGTGLVHTAPGHGQEDFRVGKREKLPIISFVGLDGRYTDGKLKGLHARECNETIIKELENRGYLLAREKISHEYPTCWRCETPLLFIAIPQWFFKVTSIRNRLLRENEKTGWQPVWAKARFKNWLDSLGDWPIGRQRYWGIPLPIWICEKNGALQSNAQFASSHRHTPSAPKDLHRPFVDRIKIRCRKCKASMSRVSDVLDVWFDAGLASWASLGWPMNTKKFKKLWPADLNIEGPDQIRGWWNSQLISSVILFERAPFKHILLHGFVLDAHGIKMSKSRGNIVNPADVAERGFPVDALRFYLLTSPPWNDFFFNWKDMEEVNRSLGIIKNSLNFVKTYVPRASGKIKLKEEDGWILSRMNSVLREVTGAMQNNEPHRATELIKDFAVNDFSRVYIKLIRDRVWPLAGEDKAAYYTLYTVSEFLCRMLAPFTPFFAEELYQDYIKPINKKAAESIHLLMWPEIGKSDPRMEGRMRKALRVSELANAIRNEQKIKLRWPLRQIIAGKESADAVKTFGDVICRLSNVKSVKTGSREWQKQGSGINVWLDTEMDEDLKKEACVREIIRHVQEARKKEGLVINDKVDVSISGFDASDYENEIKKNVGARSMGKVKDGKKIELDFEGSKITITYAKTK